MADPIWRGPEPSPSHRGILFLDETPEFSSQALDALRQPLESGYVVTARSAGVVRFPATVPDGARGQPCPCGRYSQKDDLCDCPSMSIRRYQARISGPLLDRVDPRVTCGPRSLREQLYRVRRARRDHRDGRGPGTGGQGADGGTPQRTLRGAPTARCPAVNCDRWHAVRGAMDRGRTQSGAGWR
ncbi:ATP-binding protein [Streptomyces sp. L7]